MEVALYARVSTSQQEEEATIESQVAALEEYARKQDYQVRREHYYLDQAVSGASLVRPALDQLRDQAAEQGFTVLLCLSPDRLARQYVHQRLLLDEFEREGVQVQFLNQPALEDSPSSRLLLGIQGLFAEYEREVITDRLRRGKLYQIRRGQHYYPAPYGYRYLAIGEAGGGRWEVHPAEARVVGWIYQWYTEEGLNLCGVAQRLDNRGKEAPTRNGRPWHPNLVRSILRQTAYLGTAYYNRNQVRMETVGQPKRQGRGPRKCPLTKLRPAEEWIAVTVPTLIEPSTWQRAQERLVENRQFAKRNNHHRNYLLRGLLVCGICGHGMGGQFGGGHCYYYCRGGGKRHLPDVPVHTCGLSAEVAEKVVWEAIADLLRSPERLAEAYQQTQEQPVSDMAHLKPLEKRLKQLQQQEERLLDAYQDGLLSKETWTTRLQLIGAEKKRVETQQVESISQQEQHLRQVTWIQNFTEFASRMSSALANPDFATKQEIVRLLIDHILVEGNTLTIFHIVPELDPYRLSQSHE